MYTKGPWTVCALQNGNNGIVAPSGGTIAQVCHADVKTQRANARLIASAPELLEACKHILEYMKEYASDNSVLREGSAAYHYLAAAISKAEGREGKP